MLVSELYRRAKALMFEKPSSTIYDNYIIAITNRVIGELFNENNMCRLFNGKPELEEIPQVEELTDDVDYEDEYCINVIPIGIAMYFLIDDDLQKFSIYRTDYNNARVLHQKMVSSERF